MPSKYRIGGTTTTITTLLILNGLFVLLPPNELRHPKLLRFFNVSLAIFTLVTLFGAPLAIVLKDQVFDDVPLMSRLVYDLSFVFLYVTNIYLAAMSWFKRHQMSGFLDELARETTSRLNWTVFLLVHSVNTVSIFVTQLKRTAHFSYYFNVVFIDGFLTFRLMVGLFFVVVLMDRIRKRVRDFNGHLVVRWNDCGAVKRYRFSHNTLCDYAYRVNAQFGVVLLLVVFYFITSFLRHAVFISLNYKVHMVPFVRGLWILSYGFQVAYLAHIGEQIANETRKTVMVCYRMMPKSVFHLSNVNSELFLLAQQAFARKITFSAAGFFCIDNTMIMFITTTFFTYFIVVMQLLSSS